MSYRLIVLTSTGPSEGPVFRSFLDALGEAVTALRNGITFPQIILNGSGELEKRIEPEARRVKRRPVFGGGFESGSVVTPGLSLTGWTDGPFLAPSQGGGLCAMGGTLDALPASQGVGGLSATGCTSNPRRGC
jgi:hypothetical protein